MALDGSDLDLDLPRTQIGASPQHLIITLLGDYWISRKEHLPSAALVDVASEFGISTTSARAALSRLARRGLLESSKNGRNTFYGLTPRARSVLDEGLDRIMRLGLDRRPWNGDWLVVMFSVPEDRRDVRHVLRTRLRWYGFGSLYDGAWVSPRADEAETTALLEDLGVDNSTIFRGVVVQSTGTGDPLAAWDLDAVRQEYERFIEEFQPTRERVARGHVGGAEALEVRTRVMDVWRQFPNLDPGLPEDVLPAAWPRQRARDTFAEIYDNLGPIAAARFQQILDRYAPTLTPATFHQTTTVRRGARAD